MDLVQYFELITTADHDYYINFIFDNSAYKEDIESGGRLTIRYDNRTEACCAYNNLLTKLGLDYGDNLMDIG